MIHLNNISFSYKKEKILEQIHLQIKEKKFTVITGPSGTGKTTLLYIIAGFLKPQAGTCYYKKKKSTEVFFQIHQIFKRKTWDLFFKIFDFLIR